MRREEIIKDPIVLGWYHNYKGLCREIKEGNRNAIKRAAKELAWKIPDKSIFIPVPGHEGTPDYTLALVAGICNEMKKIGKADVVIYSYLRCTPHQSLCELKKQKKPIEDVTININWANDYQHVTLKRAAENNNIFIVDNVIDTGKTAAACLAFLEKEGIRNARVTAIGMTKIPYSSYDTNILLEAQNKINDWLKSTDLTATVSYDKLEADQCGEYEMGSVFEKDIQIRVDTDNVRTFVEESCPWESPEAQMRITAYHELGHALLEQILDWCENIDEANTLVEGEFGKRYEEVFDDALPEEDLVEDFAYFFEKDKKSTLCCCFEELNKILNNVKEPSLKEYSIELPKTIAVKAKSKEDAEEIVKQALCRLFNNEKI